MATVWPLLVAATGFLGLRLYCKLSIRRTLWWDDWVLILAWICLVGQNIITTETIKYGYGRHIYDIPFENLTQKLPLLANIGATFSILAAVWSKTSFAITLLRITQGWLWVAVWCIIVTMNVAMGLSALFVWIQCTPVEKSWNPLLEGTCFSRDTIIDFLVFSAAYSAAMDIILALLPWKVVLPLNMKTKEKIGVLVAMSMGLVAATTAIIKIVQIPRMKSGDICEWPDASKKGGSILTCADDGVVLVVWGTAESAVTIMAASVPVLRSLLAGNKNKYKAPTPSPKGPKKMRFNPESFTMQSQSTVVIESRRRSFDKERSYWKSESRSARTSLDMQPQEGTILQISEVAVEYSRPSTDEEMGMYSQPNKYDETGRTFR